MMVRNRNERTSYDPIGSFVDKTGGYPMETLILLGGGLLIIIFAVVIAVVSSVVSAIAADQDQSED